MVGTLSWQKRSLMHAARLSPRMRRVVKRTCKGLCRRRRRHVHDDAQLVRGLDGTTQRLGQRLVDGVHAVQRHELLVAARVFHRQLQDERALTLRQPQLLYDVLHQEADEHVASGSKRGKAGIALDLHPQDARLGADRRTSRGLVVVDAVAAARAHTITNVQDGGRRVLAGLQTRVGARGKDATRESEMKAAKCSNTPPPRSLRARAANAPRGRPAAEQLQRKVAARRSVSQTQPPRGPARSGESGWGRRAKT